MGAFPSARGTKIDQNGRFDPTSFEKLALEKLWENRFTSDTAKATAHNVYCNCWFIFGTKVVPTNVYKSALQ